jgi:hypothetical protein
MRRLSLFIFATLLLFSGNAFATNFYVTTTGSDGAAGGMGTPWLTIGKCASTIAAGDVCNVAAGTYAERVTESTAGGAGFITYLASGTVIMNGFRLTGSNIKVDGFEMDGANIGGPDYSDASNSAGVYITGDNNQVLNCHIHHTHSNGIYASPAADGGTIQNNVLEYDVQAAIYIDGGSNFTVEGNDISHTLQIIAGMSSGANDSDGILPTGSGHIFRRNNFHDITITDTGNATSHPDYIYTSGPFSNITIEYNTFATRNDANAHSIFMSSTGTISNINIRYNIFRSLKTSGASYQIQGGADTGSFTTLNVYNNVFYGAGGQVDQALDIYAAITTLNVKNNAFYNFGNSGHQHIFTDASVTGKSIDYNGVYTTGTTPLTANQGAHDVWMSNPLFVSSSDFHLQSGSPLLNAGISVSLTTDYDGVTVGNPPDIGAFEFVAACTPDHLTFTGQPSSAILNATLGTVNVAVKDSGGITCTSATDSITLSKNGSATWGTLASGSSLTKAATAGVATWTDLSVTTTAGSGSIDAAASGLTGATSNSITISSAGGVGSGRLRIH